MKKSHYAAEGYQSSEFGDFGEPTGLPRTQLSLNIVVFIAMCCILHVFGRQLGKHNPMSERAEKNEDVHPGSSKTMIIAETCLNFQ